MSNVSTGSLMPEGQLGDRFL